MAQGRGWQGTFTYFKKPADPGMKNIPEVLNFHMNEIYRKITTIKLNKLKLKKVFT